MQTRRIRNGKSAENSQWGEQLKEEVLRNWREHSHFGDEGNHSAQSTHTETHCDDEQHDVHVLDEGVTEANRCDVVGHSESAFFVSETLHELLFQSPQIRVVGVCSSDQQIESVYGFPVQKRNEEHINFVIVAHAEEQQLQQTEQLQPHNFGRENGEEENDVTDVFDCSTRFRQCLW